MSTFAIIVLACATCFAAGTALWITVTFLHNQRLLQKNKAAVVRAQLISQLHAIREAVVPRGRGLDVLQKEIYEPLQYLWVQADLLEPEELHVMNRCASMLLALRHKPSLNQTQARLAHNLIDETCSILIRSQERAKGQDNGWFPALGLAKNLPGLRFIGTDSASPCHEPGTPPRIGLLKS